MDKVTTILYELLWSNCSSAAKNTERQCEMRSGIIVFDAIEYEVGLDQTNALLILERMADDDLIRLCYCEPMNNEPFVSYSIYDHSWRKFYPDYLPAYSVASQKRAWHDKHKEYRRDGYVYLLKGKTGHYKIGRSVSPDARIKKLEVNLPFAIKPIHLIQCSDCLKAERELHLKFRNKKTAGEWFLLSNEDVAYIKSIARL